MKNMRVRVKKNNLDLWEVQIKKWIFWLRCWHYCPHYDPWDGTKFYYCPAVFVEKEEAIEMAKKFKVYNKIYEPLPDFEKKQIIEI